ncbi:SirB2 family protein [Pantoea sp. 1.19]|uniref:SirB2 family protein n=1 Tax=Pantoea sp. 1.19 TaxID=1925589 RepID=UPI000948AD3C|nr:SirB2 family protein [Pantoea sp. 1.19]
MAWYPTIKWLHFLTFLITLSLFLLRFYWLQRSPARLQQRWVRIVPHVNDTLLLLSGVVLMVLSGRYPFTPAGAALTEKLLGVILYIGLGAVVLSRRPRAMKTRWTGFIMALVTLGLIFWLGFTGMPLLGIV